MKKLSLIFRNVEEPNRFQFNSSLIEFAEGIIRIAQKGLLDQGRNPSAVAAAGLTIAMTARKYSGIDTIPDLVLLAKVCWKSMLI